VKIGISGVMRKSTPALTLKPYYFLLLFYYYYILLDTIISMLSLKLFDEPSVLSMPNVLQTTVELLQEKNFLERVIV